MHGLKTISSEFSVAQTIDRMVAVIKQQGWHLFARIDHAGQAHEKGLALRPTQLILFGNPEIGTLLMRDQQLVGLDLPMKVLAWEDEEAKVWVTHNTLHWLEQRHRLTDTTTLQAIDAVLAKVCNSAQSHVDRGDQPTTKDD